MNPNAHQHETKRHLSRGKWVLLGFLLIGGYFLLTEHRAHVIGLLPFLLLLACPLMHLFHHGHGHHAHGADPAASSGDNADTKDERKS